MALVKIATSTNNNSINYNTTVNETKKKKEIEYLIFENNREMKVFFVLPQFLKSFYIFRAENHVELSIEYEFSFRFH